MTAVSVVVVVAVVAVLLGSRMWNSLFGGGDNDYTGSGVNDVVIQIHDGDSTTAIGKTLLDNKVVATVKSFVDAADGNDSIAAIQPGFYKVRTEIPASSAVSRLADPANRVGKLVIPEGRQLDDVSDVKTKAVTDGIFALISKASCVDLDDNQRCVSAADLKAIAGTATPAALGVRDHGHPLAVHKNAENACLGGQFVETGELGRAGVDELAIGAQIGVGLLACRCISLGALPLLGHQRAESLFVDAQVGLGGHLQRQLQREPVRVVQREGVRSRQPRGARRLGRPRRVLEEPRP